MPRGVAAEEYGKADCVCVCVCVCLSVPACNCLTVAMRQKITASI